MRAVRKMYVAYGTATDMCAALGVSNSWLSNACNSEGTLKGVSVYSYWTDKEVKLTDEQLAARAVDALSEKTKERLRAMLKGV